MAHKISLPDSSQSASARLENGVLVQCRGPSGQKGDPIEVYAGDDLLGTATLWPERRGVLSARIALDGPDLTFPTELRVMNARTGGEIGKGLPLADAATLLQAAGPPEITAVFAGLYPAGLAFTVTIDRAARHGRVFDLYLGGQLTASAVSVPDPSGVAHGLVFPLTGPIAPGTPCAIIERRFGVTALSRPFDLAMVMAGSAAQVARLTGEVAALREETVSLRRRLDTALDLGRERLLLERLDLFYLLLCERIERMGDLPRPAPDMAPVVRRFGPAEVDGIGIYDVERDGQTEWRWFGPDATIALRDLAAPARRVVLYFLDFSGTGEPLEVRVSTGGPPEPTRLRALEGRHALDVPVSRTALVGGDMLVLHLSFDRHQTSNLDPRLLSAAFSGAEVMLEAV